MEIARSQGGPLKGPSDVGTKGEDSLGERREQTPGAAHWYHHRDVNWGTGIKDY